MSENIGLFVYGGLLMVLSFVVGLTMGDHLTMSLALTACAAAALVHAFIETLEAKPGLATPTAIRIGAWMTITSWLFTAAAFVSATITLL